MNVSRCHRTSARPIRRMLAGRVVLKPTRNTLKHGDQVMGMIRVNPYELACFVRRKGLQAGPQTTIESILQAEPPELLVIKMPGTSGRAERSSPFPADLLPDLKTEIWTWNPPGYGTSSGRASLKTLAEAAPLFFDSVILKRCGPQTKVWICANSLGCTPGLYLAANRVVDGLILRNPPPLIETIPSVAAGYRPKWLRPVAVRVASWISGGVPPCLDALCTSSHCAAPAVFLESGRDRIVPPHLQKMIRNCYGGLWKLVEMEELEHHQAPEDVHLNELRSHLRWLWYGENIPIQ